MTRILMAALFSLAMLAPAGAAVHNDSDYGPVDKLGRGVADITTGVLALPATMMERTNEDGASGIPVGFGVGLARTVARELVGVYELVTFPLPVPSNYQPVLRPDYPWQYFDQSRVDVGRRDSDTSVGVR